MNTLNELKATIEAAQNGQLKWRKEFAKSLSALGYSLYHEHRFPHPKNEGEFVVIHIQDCFGNETSKYNGYFCVDIMGPHICDEECGYNCDREEDILRRASAEEVSQVLATDLSQSLGYEKSEEQRDAELAKSLPTEEDLAKMRRRIEDYLRKNPKDIPATVKLLKLI
jgi:hypothetical protein